MMMKVCFNPNEKPAGCCSFASWDNPRTKKAIRELFNESERENITRIDIDRHGIMAYFETRASVMQEVSAN